jgi:hypothetical protein
MGVTDTDPLIPVLSANLEVPGVYAHNFNRDRWGSRDRGSGSGLALVFGGPKIDASGVWGGHFVGATTVVTNVTGFEIVSYLLTATIMKFRPPGADVENVRREVRVE